MVHADPYGAFRKEAQALLEEAIFSLRLDSPATHPVRLGQAPEGKGDFAFACFPLAKAARKSPADVANDILAAVAPSRHLHFAAEGPYVNVTVAPATLVTETIRATQAQGARFGTLPAQDAKVVLEHTSANPNGPFHVGRARNPIVGDTLARILRAAGYHVVTEYYVNDMGKQVAILAWGLANIGASEVPAPERQKIDHQLVVYYQEANKRMKESKEVEEAIGDLLRRFESGDQEVADMFRDAVTRVLQGMRESLERMHVRHDNWKWESEFVFNGAVTEIIDRLRAAPEARQEDDGAWYLDLSAHGIPGRTSRVVFTRKDGTSLYPTRDLAYHMDKFRRANRLVNVLGEDHKLTMRQLEIGLSILGEKRPIEMLFYSFVSLPEGKMSTRRGVVVFIDDLLDEAVARALEEVRKRRGGELSEEAMERIANVVGIGALRFNIVSVQPEKGIVFRWEEALSFDGATAPFVQYAHARCAGILANAERTATHPAYDQLTHPSEVALARAVARLPSEVSRAAESFAIHQIPAYAVELANALNNFYRDCPVGRAEPGLREARMDLVAATKATLAHALELLGIEAPDSM
ncbi:MAG: arginine--tRNA ligase [Thermoplasmatota archaeon]